jgi:CBS domain-containing protein
MNVQDLMTHAPAVCTTTDHASRAAQIMWERDCGCVPVMDADGKLSGVVTDRDLCMAAYTQGRALHEIPIANAMSKTVFTVGPDTGLDDALALMLKHSVRRLPVVDAENRLVGMLSTADIVRASRSGAARRRPKAEDVLETLAGVMRARTPAHVAAPPSDVLVPAAPVQAAAARRKLAGSNSPQAAKPARRR